MQRFEIVRLAGRPLLLAVIPLVAIVAMPVAAAQNQRSGAQQPAAQQTGAQQPAAAEIPPVLLSTQHLKLTNIKVGDKLPAAELVNARTPEGDRQPLALGNGRAATVVTMFRGRGRMTRTMLRDLRHDVAETYADLGTEGAEAKPAVTTTAIAIEMPADEALAVADETGYAGPVVLDSEGQYFAQIGTERLPRVFVLDAEGTVVWMDIEYSQATRRELRQTLRALTARLRQ